MKNTLDYFEVSKNNIYCVGLTFKEVFKDTKFNIPKKLELQSKTLKKPMLNKEILEQWKAEPVTLGDVAYALENICSKQNWYIFYVKDSKNILWAVGAYWDSIRRGWDVDAYSVEDPDEWRAGNQVLSRVFGVFEPLDSLNFELRIKNLEDDMIKLKKIIKQK